MHAKDILKLWKLILFLEIKFRKIRFNVFYGSNGFDKMLAWISLQASLHYGFNRIYLKARTVEMNHVLYYLSQSYIFSPLLLIFL